jgi:four helix bundle protein
MPNHEKLVAWQVACQLAQEIELVSRAPAFRGASALGLQMRKAAVSVSSNIAEGHGRAKRAEFAGFLRVARGSAVEVQSQLAVSLGQGRLTFRRYQAVRALADRTVALVTKLHASVAAQTERG